MCIQQRASGISGIDGGVRLNQIFHRRLRTSVADSNRAVEAADYALSKRTAEIHAHGISNRTGILPDGDIIRISQFYCLQIIRFDFDNGQVQCFVAPEHRARHFPAIVQIDVDRTYGSVIYHVGIGEDIPVFIYDKARSYAAYDLRSAVPSKDIRHLAFHLRADAYDRGHYFFVNCLPYIHGIAGIDCHIPIAIDYRGHKLWKIAGCQIDRGDSAAKSRACRQDNNQYNC